MESNMWFNYRPLYDCVVNRLHDEGVKDPVLVEVGVWLGASISHLADRLIDRYGREAFELHAVDLWSHDIDHPEENAEVRDSLKHISDDGKTLFESYRAYVQDRQVYDQICEHRADSADTAEFFGNESVDFVFIDADHAHGAVLRDIEAWKNKAVILAGHDVSDPAIDQALRKVFGIDYYKMPAIDCWTTDAELAETVNNLHSSVFLGTPVGAGGGIDLGNVAGIIHADNSRRVVNWDSSCGSLLPHMFNALLCNALNNRERFGLEWFVLLHSDIVPVQIDWVDHLLDTCDNYEADVISAVVPIKDGNGLTSTAVDTDKWRPRRITMTEIMELPEVFDNDLIKKRFGGNLLLNTAMMAFRLTSDWCQNSFPCFGFDTQIFRDEHGVYHCDIEPEDWKFSRWCHTQNLKLVATRKLGINHMGSVPFNNFGAWGKLKTDTVNCPETASK